ncbi:unnamed protein product, partial [Ilex paraguariensis]
MESLCSIPGILREFMATTAMLEEQVDRSVGLVVEQGMTEESGGGKLEMASCSTLKQSPLPMKETPLNYHPYPPPLARYEDVVACPRLFMDTLEKLHATMRTKFMIPVIGGKDLDLHLLFVEVTSRGGIEK